MCQNRAGGFLSNSSGSVAEVWFHVESADGAGLNPKMYKAPQRANSPQLRNIA